MSMSSLKASPGAVKSLAFHYILQSFVLYHWILCWLRWSLCRRRKSSIKGTKDGWETLFRTSLDHGHGLEQVRNQEMVYNEAWSVLALDAHFAHVLSPLFHGLEGSIARLRNTNDLGETFKDLAMVSFFFF